MALRALSVKNVRVLSVSNVIPSAPMYVHHALVYLLDHRAKHAPTLHRKTGSGQLSIKERTKIKNHLTANVPEMGMASIHSPALFIICSPELSSCHVIVKH